jgi:hypothetical protein
LLTVSTQASRPAPSEEAPAPEEHDDARERRVRRARETEDGRALAEDREQRRQDQRLQEPVRLGTWRTDANGAG